MRYVVEAYNDVFVPEWTVINGYDANQVRLWRVRDQNTNQYEKRVFADRNSAEFFATILDLNMQNTNQKEKDTMQVHWKEWKGVPRDVTAVNDSAVQVLEDLKVDENYSYVMGGDTLVIGFREGDKMIALYKCRIMATAEFTERTTWVQED